MYKETPCGCRTPLCGPRPRHMSRRHEKFDNTAHASRIRWSMSSPAPSQSSPRQHHGCHKSPDHIDPARVTACIAAMHGHLNLTADGPKQARLPPSAPDAIVSFAQVVAHRPRNNCARLPGGGSAHACSRKQVLNRASRRDSRGGLAAAVEDAALLLVLEDLALHKVDAGAAHEHAVHADARQLIHHGLLGDVGPDGDAPQDLVLCRLELRFLQRSVAPLVVGAIVAFESTSDTSKHHADLSVTCFWSDGDCWPGLRAQQPRAESRGLQCAALSLRRWPSVDTHGATDRSPDL